MLRPVVDNLKNSAGSLEKHIKGIMTPECEETAAVSKTLNTVRQLIISLEKCPGKNDFPLVVPVISKKPSPEKGSITVLRPKPAPPVPEVVDADGGDDDHD